MTFLPVAQRELLAASRRKSTFRMRIWAALFAAGLTFLMLLFVSVSGAGAQSGRFVFYTLVFGGHLYAVLAGVLLTADGISEERRDGTLGLLFLTDLTGIDVVAGKFVGLALSAFYGLAAIFPVLAISWFMGGISNGEFWRNCAALLNELFFATCVGLAISAGESRQARALGKTLIVLGVFVVGLPALDQVLKATGTASAWSFVTWMSPSQVLVTVRDTEYFRNPGGFLRTLGISHLTAWAFLGYAAIVLNRGWRSETGAGDRPSQRRFLDRRWLAKDPLRALLACERWPVRVAWAVGGVALVTMGLAHVPGIWADGCGQVILVLTVVIKGLMAWEVTSFIAEARRTGALELLLATPIRDAEIGAAVHSHLARRYLLPLLLVVACQFAAGGAWSGSLLLPVIDSIGTLVQVLALGSVGLWFALSEPRPMVAFAKTFGATVILATALDFVCCIGLVIPPIMAAWAQSKLRLPYRDILSGVRSHWQHRDGWMHATAHSGGTRPSPPPLPFRRLP